MSKPKSPLLSLDAHGSLGNTLTYQGASQRKIVRAKPQLPYFLTLPSQYQRWLYQDYIAQWNALTNAQKQTYRSAGSRYHLTGLQYWMKDHLKNLPDLAAYWKLDANTGATTSDSSRNNNTLTIIGASPATGLIDGCLTFDGLNDRLGAVDTPSLNPPGAFTIETLIRTDTYTALPGRSRGIVCKRTANPAGNPGYNFFIYDDADWGKLRVMFDDGVARNSLISAANNAVTPNVWHHLAVVFDPSTSLTSYIDAVVDAQLLVGVIASIGSSTEPVLVGFGIQSASPWQSGLLDNIVLTLRAKSQAEILVDSLRRWPP